MNVRIIDRVGRVNMEIIVESCYMPAVPNVGDHIYGNGKECIVTGRLFYIDKTDMVDIYVRLASENDDTYL